MALQGNLAEVTASNLVQGLLFGDKTGLLFVQRDQQQAELWLHNYNIHAASVFPLTPQPKLKTEGESAVLEILGWPSGNFIFQAHAETRVRKNVFVPFERLMIDYAWRQTPEDWQSRVRDYSQLVPQIIPGIVKVDLDVLGPFRLQLLAVINGHSSVAQLATMLKWPVKSVVGLVIELKKLNLLKLMPPVAILPAADQQRKIAFQPKIAHPA